MLVPAFPLAGPWDLGLGLNLLTHRPPRICTTLIEVLDGTQGKIRMRIG